MKYFTLISFLLIYLISNAQNQSKRVLFLGNSYTAVNDLPQILTNVAASVGDTLVFDSNSPGGHTFKGHSTNTLSLNKIAAGNWNFVVLQEQSQSPSFPQEQVEQEVYPYASILDSLVNAQNKCTETMFYMTWGRKNGDAQNCPFWPPVCTYLGMDSMLSLRYKAMAKDNNAVLSPVGALWNYLIKTQPSIELYQPDQSHPSVAGTYAAACCFYATIFRKDPTLIQFNNGLTTIEANAIKNAAKLIVYNDLKKWHVGAYDIDANFTFTTMQKEVSLTNTSLYANTYEWHFGDGVISLEKNPKHTYTNTDNYTVTLIATSECGQKDTTTQTIEIKTTRLASQNIGSNSIYPNPVASKLNVNFSFNNLNYKIYNYAGVEIDNGVLNNMNKSIDVSALADGLYILSLFENNKYIGQCKFIKTDGLE